MNPQVLNPFSPNDYRKRVLAAVERRGDPDESDSFELYDLPLGAAGTLSDEAVAARLDEVWAFWQKHRDHPKYRILVNRLVAEHEERCAPLRNSASRLAEANAVAARRAERDAERFRLLDNAIERLSDRHGGIPTSKRSGLDDIGAMGGLTAAEVATRLQRFRSIEDGPGPGPVPPPPAPVLTPTIERRLSQIDELLSECNRLRTGTPAPTLLALLNLNIDDVDEYAEIAGRADALQERARALGAGRFRAVVDELLLHVSDVLLGDPADATAYARAMTDRIATHLRPRIRAAMLVEGDLITEDQTFLIQEAVDRGLSPTAAAALVTEIAAEFGSTTTMRATRVDSSTPSSGTPAPPPVSPPPAPPVPTPPAPAPTSGTNLPPRDWAEPLRMARLLLREGRPEQARSMCARARKIAGDDPEANRQIAPVAEEVERAIADAQVPIAPAATNPVALIPAGPVTVESSGDGSFHVSWSPSSTPGVSYRVTRQGPDGRWQTVGRTMTTEMVDGGASGIVGIPVYEVTATVGGAYANPVRSEAPAVEAAPAATAPSTPAQRATDPLLPDITGVAATADRVTFTWPAGITEVMVVIRADAPPVAPDDPQARSIKVTNTRYEIDGGFILPAEIARPCHLAIASCRRDAAGTRIVALGFGSTAHTYC